MESAVSQTGMVQSFEVEWRSQPNWKMRSGYWNGAVRYVESTLAKYFRLHLERGISHLAGTGLIKSLDDLIDKAMENQE